MEISWNDIYETLKEGINMPFSYFFNPGKRVHVLYLASSLAIAYGVFLIQKPETTFFKYLFPKKVWLSKSAGTDYSLLFLNAFVKVLFIGPYLIYGLYTAFWVNEYLENIFGFYTLSRLSVTETLVYYALALAIVGDFATYVVHYLMHRIPYLWEFHKTHHSATVMNPFTQFRLHPVELIINNAKGILVFGLMTGIFDYFSHHQINKLTFLGVNAFTFGFLFLGSNLRHSHVRFRYLNFLEYFFISPYQHQIHHSNNPAHHHKNMGAKLAVWDWLFGTLLRSKQVPRLKFGLGKEDDPHFDTFLKNVYTPFRKCWSMVEKRKKKTRKD